MRNASDWQLLRDRRPDGWTHRRPSDYGCMQIKQRWKQKSYIDCHYAHVSVVYKLFGIILASYSVIQMDIGHLLHEDVMFTTANKSAEFFNR